MMNIISTGFQPGHSLAWHSFEMKHPAEWLTLHVEHPENVWLQMVVRDAEGRVRMQYLTKGLEQTLVLCADPGRSTCGTVPGLLPQGEWTVQVYGMKPEVTASYRLSMRTGTGAPDTEGTLPPIGRNLWTGPADPGMAMSYKEYPWERVVSTEPRWYKGDFHMHTRLTDGKQTPAELTAQAAGQGLDFMVITEHNFLTTGWPETELLVIPGTEVTSSKGHFNILGIREWIEPFGDGSQPVFETVEGMVSILQAAREQGAVCSMNHPELVPWEWQLDVRLDAFDTIEIWNDPTYPDNTDATEKALQLWDVLWAHGVILWGIGGSDTHNLPHESYEPGGPPSVVGDPRTCVWSDELSVQGMMSAIRQGHVYVTRGPELDPFVAVGERVFRPGECIPSEIESEEPVVCHLGIRGIAADASVRWMVDGVTVSESRVGGGKGGSEDFLRFSYDVNWPNEGLHWVRAEVRDAEGGLLAFTNPVYKGQPVPALATWNELKSKLEPAAAGVAN
ncbi:CehA/McbA family metallohydrolase [Paenibacillus sp. P96]|uniref:CehA/McbA family metallohydrolase n=1 Tax=Paenibacillus zeirhizosphaerae TaxID=2987519 RepID=A0ABT9FMJ0_9BACL|nr:CehA/McbA family metallohydrolase [Paenibacillus sp. P96]MDP4095810.1 CehA/McbA family metallohydrolase [Paenibacillus sp. P96]